VQAGLGLFMEPGFVLRNIVDNDSGTLRFAFTQLNPSPAKSGSGHLIVVKLRAKQLSSGSPLTLNVAELARRDGIGLPVNTVGGQISIVEAVAGPTSTSLPTQGAGTPLPTGTGLITTLEPPPTTTIQPPAGAASPTPPAPLAATPTPVEGVAPTSAVDPGTAYPAATDPATDPAGATALALATATATATANSGGTPVAAVGLTVAAEATLGTATGAAVVPPAGPSLLFGLGGLALLVILVGVGSLVYFAAKPK
jgi:hypothetical protein